jgi:chloramphenicol 3-O phosphotransferase
VILEPAWVEECRRLWAGFEWWLVAVRCPLAVVEQRERDRRDRTLGQAAAQYAVVHAHGATYDVEVDTSVLSPDVAAARIVAALAR